MLYDIILRLDPTVFLKFDYNMGMLNIEFLELFCDRYLTALCISQYFCRVILGFAVHRSHWLSRTYNSLSSLTRIVTLEYSLCFNEPIRIFCFKPARLMPITKT